MKAKNVIYIAGTDTGVGKTVIAGCLAYFFSRKGYRTVTQKWVQTGNKGRSDIDLHLKLMGKRREEYRGYQEYMEPCSLRFASSPHLSARLEGKKININRITKDLAALSKEFERVIVEGTGGVLVPFRDKCVAADVLKKTGIPVILVAENRVGAINHALLTIEALKARKIRILGVIFNNISGKVDRLVLRDNPGIVRKISGENILGIMPRSKNIAEMRKNFKPIWSRIKKCGI